MKFGGLIANLSAFKSTMVFSASPNSFISRPFLITKVVDICIKIHVLIVRNLGIYVLKLNENHIYCEIFNDSK